MEQGGCYIPLSHSMLHVQNDDRCSDWTEKEKTFKPFKEKGCTWIHGESISVAAKELDAVLKSLNEMNALKNGMPLCILEDQTLCSCSDFSDVFRIQLTKEYISNLRHCYSSSNRCNWLLIDILNKDITLWLSLHFWMLRCGKLPFWELLELWRQPWFVVVQREEESAVHWWQ